MLSSSIVMVANFNFLWNVAAVVCWGMGGPVKVEEIQVEPPKSFEVRVKMLYASVCHTDVIGTKGYPFVSIC